MAPEELLDRRVAASLESLSVDCTDYWAFSASSSRSFCHDYFQYPAMMVPEMLGQLMRLICETDTSINTVFDPFAGSGTVLTEAMLLGKSFVGFDINPLAVLLCKAKSGPFRYEYLCDVAEEVIERMQEDPCCRIEARFPNRAKWFEDHVAVDLSRIVRSVRQVPELWCRRFLWVALAETVRLTSNSRTSTFKLHIRSESDRATRRVDPRQVFADIVEKNLGLLDEFRDALTDRKLLSRGAYTNRIRVALRDASRTYARLEKLDFLVTSPPYGDNTTTVPYGQHSYLPLQWIDLADIEDAVPECLLTTHEIDRRSLGGIKRAALKDAEGAMDRSPTFRSAMTALKNQPVDRRTRAAAFIRDLDRCIEPILSRLRRNAYMIWVIGNRRIGGQQLRADQILRELLEARRAMHVCTIRRRIPTKRMATKNSVTDTMSKEQIILFRHARPD
jgi:hypothetical protein